MVRLKHRYIIGRLACTSESANNIEINSKDLQQALSNCIQNLYGEVGMGSFGFNSQIKYYDPLSKVYIFRLPREYLKEVQFSLSCVNTLKKNDNLALVTLAISGSARTCKNKVLSIINCFWESESYKSEKMINNYKDQIERLEI